VQWIPAAYLPVMTAETGFNAETELLNQLFLVAASTNALDTLKSQQNEVGHSRFDWDAERLVSEGRTDDLLRYVAPLEAGSAG
jgi:hypothetical protein